MGNEDPGSTWALLKVTLGDVPQRGKVEAVWIVAGWDKLGAIESYL
jgi:hypothetical protein